MVEVLDKLRQRGRKPKTICVDNGSEFKSKIMDQWSYLQKVKLDLSRPGKPTDNAMIESFNSRFRQECLNEHWFWDIRDAGAIIESFRVDYNWKRPHSSLGNLTPCEFMRMFNRPATPDNFGDYPAGQGSSTDSENFDFSHT